MRGIYNYEAKPPRLGEKLSGINGQCRQANCGKGEESDPQLQPIILFTYLVLLGHFIQDYYRLSSLQSLSLLSHSHVGLFLNQYGTLGLIKYLHLYSTLFFFFESLSRCPKWWNIDFTLDCIVSNIFHLNGYLKIIFHFMTYDKSSQITSECWCGKNDIIQNFTKLFFQYIWSLLN